MDFDNNPKPAYGGVITVDAARRLARYIFDLYDTDKSGTLDLAKVSPMF
jgi:hypothetical protein